MDSTAATRPTTAWAVRSRGGPIRMAIVSASAKVIVALTRSALLGPARSEAGLDGTVAATDEGAGAVAGCARGVVGAVDVVEVDARHTRLLHRSAARGEPRVLDGHIQGRSAGRSEERRVGKE